MKAYPKPKRRKRKTKTYRAVLRFGIPPKGAIGHCMKTVIIEIHKGCAVVARQPQGTRIIIRDYDVLDATSCQFNSIGQPFTEQTYTNIAGAEVEDE